MNLISRSCLLLLISLSRLNAQTNPIDFRWGTEYELPKKYEDLGFIGNAADGYMQVSHREGDGLMLQKFGSDLQLVSEKEVSLDKLPRNYQSEFLVRSGGKYFWFFSSGGFRKPGSVLYAQEISLASSELVGAPKELLSVEEIGENLAVNAYGLTEPGRFSCYQSADSSKLLIQYRNKPAHRNDSRSNDVIGLHVFDAQLNKLWGGDMTMPYTEKLMDNKDYQLDSKGNVYTLAKVFANMASPVDRNPSYRFELIKWSAANGTKPTKIPFRVPGKFISSARIGETKTGEVAVAGYYASRMNGPAAGVFAVKIDERTTAIDNTMTGFAALPKEALDAYAKSRKEQGFLILKANREDNVLLRKLVFNDDGSAELYGEEQHIETNIVGSGRDRYKQITYSYNDIWVAKIGAQGPLAWAANIPKMQQGFNYLGCMSFKHHCYQGKNYLLYMTGPKGDLYRDENKGVLAAATIGPDGSVVQTDVSEMVDERIKLTVSDFNEVGPNQLMARGRAKHRVSKASLVTFQ